ncbi:MAG: sensor histidine kinase [Pedobacter sp.]|nr:MAG: sensor histidine kinase [Pedobacter sp.]
MMYWNLGTKTSLIDTLVSNILLAGTCLLIINNFRYYRPAKNAFVFILMLCVALCICWLFLTIYLLGKLTPGNTGFLYASIPVRYLIGFLITCCTSMISLTWYHTSELQESQQIKSETEAIAKDAELYSLRQQLQPHFLFNSLNSISALIGSNPTLSRTMIQQLSGFLRGTLNKDDKTSISLAEEMAHLQLYLDIEKVRFGHRLETKTEMLADGAMIPPMILQPIVENAIKFGLYDTIGTVTITVIAMISGNDLVIRVQNPYDPETSDPRKGTGFGLSSIRRRLYLIFSRNDLLETSFTDTIFTTTVKIPQHVQGNTY